MQHTDNKNIAIAGNKGKNARSDCFVSLQLKNTGGLTIEINNKSKVNYSNAIDELCQDILEFFEIANARLVIEDAGALPFVIAARIEAAIHQLIHSDKEYHREVTTESQYESSKERQRTARLYLPGNDPGTMINAGINNPDAIILDLEDAVAPNRKKEAQILVRNALRELNFFGAERMVRINQLPNGLEDLRKIIPHNVHVILIPRCEGAEQVNWVESEIDKFMHENLMIDMHRQIYLMPIIETALGIERAFEIAIASEYIIGMALELEDLAADLGIHPTTNGYETLFARSRIVNACKAAGIQAFDTVYYNENNPAGLKEAVVASKNMGFDGMGCIQPTQIKIIQENYAPNQKEIEKAKEIIQAFLFAKKQGKNVISARTKFIDTSSVKQAQKIINQAISLELIDDTWIEKQENLSYEKK